MLTTCVCVALCRLGLQARVHIYIYIYIYVYIAATLTFLLQSCQALRHPILKATIPHCSAWMIYSALELWGDVEVSCINSMGIADLRNLFSCRLH